MTDKNAQTQALEARIDELLNDLDEIARDVCVHDYGLPLASDHSRARLRERVRLTIESAAHRLRERRSGPSRIRASRD